MKVLIYGATGATGKHLVQQAVALGHSVTAFARNPQKINISAPNLIVVGGELTNKQLIEKTIEGQDAVMSALGASSMFTYDKTVVDGIQTILNAMQSKKVDRFIYLSFSGVRESRHKMGFVIKYIAPKLLSTEIARHEDCERMIRLSNLDWTIVRPPTLSNDKPLGNFRVGENISSARPITTISRADVASFMLQQLTDTIFVRKAPLILQ
jgi:putative NADH-flavin reductase